MLLEPVAWCRRPSVALVAAPERRCAETMRHPVVLAVLATTALALAWTAFLPSFGTDLAAQITRAHFARAHPSSAYDFSWYGGVSPAAYSVLAPYVFAVVGTRTASALAAVLCAALITSLFVRCKAPRPRAAALWTAAAQGIGLLAGRATFTVGLAAALGAVLVAHGARPGPALRRALAVALALLSVLLSPVAGLFVGVAAATFVLTDRRVDGAVLAAAAGAPLALIAVIFGRGGVQPISVLNGVPTIAAVVIVLVLVPREWRAVRVGAVVYAVGVVAAWIVPTALGSNVERLGLLLAGPVVVGMSQSGQRARRLLALGVAGIAIWQVVGPLRDFAHISVKTRPSGDLDTAAFIDELVVLHADTARVEAVPQYGHWESEQLAATVPLARGWERQVDTERNPLFYREHLDPAQYRAWLRRNAVRYVAVSAGHSDYAAVREAEIIRVGQPWLVPVWADTRWSLYRVSGSEPLADRPALVIGTTPAKLTVWMSRGGTTTVRVHWSKFLRVSGGGQLDRVGTWTSLTAPGPGIYVLSASY